MPKEVQHPQITEDQVEIWMAHPVTKAFLQCLIWKRDDTAEQAGTGKLVDSSNADMTHALIHRALGQQDGYNIAHDPESLLEHYVMIHHPPEKPEDD